MEYEVFVDDNFNYYDQSKKYSLNKYKTFEEALTACKEIVNESLFHLYKPGMKANELYGQYTGFGEDPYIVGPNLPIHFSAWEYAEEKCNEICNKS